MMKYVVAIVASFFFVKYARKSHMFSMKNVKSLKKMMKGYIPSMKYGKMLRAYK